MPEPAPAAGPTPEQTAAVTAKKTAAAEEQFVRDVVTRGEAAKPDAKGKLPPGATHEIVKPRRGGKGAAADLPVVRRRRFSTF